jgi:hypothetical protein
MARWIAILALGALCSVALLGGGAAAGAEKVKLAAVAGTVSSSTIPPKVKQECNVQRDLPAAIASHAGNVELVEGTPDSGLRLELVITEVHAPPGGMFSGPKWVEARGKLKRGGKELRSFRAKRASSGIGSGNCATLAKVTSVMGQDIAGWLANENAGTLLGDAR